MVRGHDRIENVFKSGELRDGFLAGSGHDVVRRTLGEDPPAIEHQHALAEREHFFATMRYVEDRDAVRVVPAAQVVEDQALGGESSAASGSSSSRTQDR